MDLNDESVQLPFSEESQENEDSEDKDWIDLFLINESSLICAIKFFNPPCQTTSRHA